MEDSTCANPLLLQWIKEWLDEARERNSKGVSVYKRAYDSMKACPLPFQHPSEAQQLNGLGPKLCERLTENMRDYCEEHGLPMPRLPHAALRSKKRKGLEKATTQTEMETVPAPAKRARKPKTYIPALRSGPYALLLGLASIEEHSPNGASKAMLIEAAQPHCDASFTAPPDPSKYYTAWNSMKTLVQKDLIYERGRPKRYLLTEQGWETATSIKNTAGLSSVDDGGHRFESEAPSASQNSIRGSQSGIPTQTANTLKHTSNPNSRIVLRLDDDNDTLYESVGMQRSSTTPNVSRDFGRTIQPTTPATPISLSPSDFTIELVLDVREIRTKTDRDYISNELIRRGVSPIVRSLEVGDALWIAKCKDPNLLARHGEEGDELMLDWILERKRLDDLIGSIKDSRFHEQKYRLRRSGVKNVIYLVEEFGCADLSNANAARSQEAVASAITSTQVVNGHFVKKTRNLDDTIRYLARITSLLRNMFADPATTDVPPNIKHMSLSLIPTQSLTSLTSYLDLLGKLRADDKISHPSHASTTFAISFPTFSAFSSKSDMLTLRDIFLKMLMCVRGVSAEKALEIQRLWPTPKEFVQAFEAVDSRDEHGKRLMDDLVFSKMGHLVGNKKVGKALSKKIAEVWGGYSSLDPPQFSDNE
ncbi:Crossover junction endonuclease mus81 [Ophidiomyces ophidiicola]|nr:Crossover junction endonuclease mus81 [Ophidiomyces ophidiicola]